MRSLVATKVPKDVSGPRLKFENCYFAALPDGKGEDAHFTLTVEGVVVKDVTIFPGQITNWDVIMWGTQGLFKQAKSRVKRFFNGQQPRIWDERAHWDSM